jgi:5-methylcytosine-specific restriction endonuclease McrA
MPQSYRPVLGGWKVYVDVSPKDEQQLLKYLLSRLQQIWGWSECRKSALKRCERWTAEGLRWECESCGKLCRREERDVDHVIARGSRPKLLSEFETYVRRTIVLPEQLKVLCKPCHKPKTAADGKKRRAAKKKG